MNDSKYYGSAASPATGTLLILSLFSPFLYSGIVSAQERPVGRSIVKEPAYQSAAPEYAVLAFGRDGAGRVWLVRDGKALFVDRNGNGDLTEPGERITAEDAGSSMSDDEGYSFQVGDVTLGEQTHRALAVSFYPLRIYFDSSLDSREDVRRILKATPRAYAITIGIDAQVAGLEGGEPGGRVRYLIGPVDPDGVLQFGTSPLTAPVIRIGGPLEVTFFSQRPKLIRGRTSDFTLVVGSPGIGPGTFASLSYEETIPNSAYPVAKITYPRSPKQDSPLVDLIKLKERC